MARERLACFDPAFDLPEVVPVSGDGVLGADDGETLPTPQALTRNRGKMRQHARNMDLIRPHRGACAAKWSYQAHPEGGLGGRPGE